MFKYVYVDTENVGLSWINMLRNMDSTWTVILFHSNNSGKVSVESLKHIQHAKCNIEYVRCGTGDNSMDFWIAVYAGSKVTTCKNSLHILFSSDAHFSLIKRALCSKVDYVGVIKHTKRTREDVTAFLNVFPTSVRDEVAQVFGIRYDHTGLAWCV